MTELEICSTVGCTRVKTRRGMCYPHYKRWWRATPKSDRLPPTAEERFWAKVDKGDEDSCWIWNGTRGHMGHGSFRPGDAKPAVKAHSYSLSLALGYPCPEGKQCCHHCDNPPCVNPKHLYFGTSQQNSDDQWARNRQPVGVDRAPAIMTNEQVIELRVRYADGANAKDLATEYGIAMTTLRQTVLGDRWKHLGGPRTVRRPNRSTRHHLQKAG